MGNALNKAINDLDKASKDGWNAVVNFFSNDVPNALTQTYNQLFGNDVKSVPVDLRPPTNNVIINNNMIDSSWSKIMRSIGKTLVFNIKSDSIELKKKYNMMTSNYTLTDKDNRTMLINIDDSTFITGTRIVIYCGVAGTLFPLVILVTESLINDLVLIGVRDISSIFIYKFERINNTITYVDPKPLIGKVNDLLVT